MNSQTNKPGEKKDKIVALNKFGYSNVKSLSKTLGKLELKYISIGDLEFFNKLIGKVADDKEFVVKVLYHQLITPKIQLTEFSKIPGEELIGLGRDFVRHEEHTFKYFKETTDAEFFTNFRRAIKIYYQKYVEQLQATLRPMIESSKRMFETFNKQYAGIIKQNTYITESIRAFSKIAKQFEEFQFHIAESLRPAIEQYQLTARLLSEALTPQINFWQKWVERNKAIFDDYAGFWQRFQEQYKITEQEAIRVLGKYKWFITPSLPLSFVFASVKIGRRGGNQRKAINRLFVNYFSQGNFRNLENLVNGWETNEIFKPRMKILRDCVSMMKKTDRKCNPSNVVLPTLIAQIDGIRIKFMNQNNLSFWSSEEYWKGLYRSQTSNQELLSLANNIFLNILFQSSQPGQPLETPFTFNRHKIMHGEYLRYGRIGNTIRAFLILDFLATLSNERGKS